jgi:fucose permease
MRLSLRSVPIFLAFFVMGFVDSVGALVGYAREQFHLSGTMAGLLPFFGFAAFALVSVPAGVLADRLGKRRVLLLGLALVLVGELLPVFGAARYAVLLAAIFLIGIGMTVLQVAGNPIMRDVSEPGRYARNLTFAQFIKSLGSNAAPYLLPLVTAMRWGWRGMFPVFAAIAAVDLLLVAGLKVPAGAQGVRAGEAGRVASLASSFALLKDPYVARVVLGIFLYVGAEVGLNSWIATHLSRSFGMDLPTATQCLGLFLGGLALGRLGGSAVLHFLSAQRFFRICALAGTLAVAGLLAPVRPVVLVSIFVAGLAFANIWPLVFALAIEERPGRASELSGLMCMAIFGGALLPLLMGRLADVASVRTAFVVPLACFAYLTYLALSSRAPQGAVRA